MPFKKSSKKSRKVHSSTGRKTFRRGSKTGGPARAPHSGNRLTTGGLAASAKESRWFPSIKSRRYTQVDRNLIPFPDREFFHLKFTQYFQLAGTTGGIMGTIGYLNLNDLHTPTVAHAGVTHRPLGVDQLSTRYVDYRVWAISVQIRLTQASVGTNYFACLPQSRDDSYTLGSEGPWEKIVEKPGIIWVDGAECTSGGAGTVVSVLGSVPVIEKTFDIAEIDGVTKMQYNADISEYTGAFGASPNFVPKLAMGVGDWNGGNASQITVQVQCVYHGVAFNRKTPNASA